MEHSVGSPTRHNLLGRTLVTPNMHAGRQYYRSRNLMFVMREYFRSNRRWVMKSVITRLKEVLLVLLFERDKALKMRAVARGIWDGMGRIRG